MTKEIEYTDKRSRNDIGNRINDLFIKIKDKDLLNTVTIITDGITEEFGPFSLHNTLTFHDNILYVIKYLRAGEEPNRSLIPFLYLEAFDLEKDFGSNDYIKESFRISSNTFLTGTDFKTCNVCQLTIGGTDNVIVDKDSANYLIHYIINYKNLNNESKSLAIKVLTTNKIENFHKTKVIIEGED